MLQRAIHSSTRNMDRTPGTFVFFLIFVGIGESRLDPAFAAPMLLRCNSL
jgi:hypothetical protein